MQDTSLLKGKSSQVCFCQLTEANQSHMLDLRTRPRWSISDEIKREILVSSNKDLLGIFDPKYANLVTS